MIYCVEDDDSIRELMLYALQASGIEAQGFPNAAGFWEAMRDGRPDLIMLDLMLPDEDGISILKKLRAYPVTDDIPIILATAKGTEYDKVMGLDLGADDYLVKPFGMMEMVSRIRAVLRRSSPPVQKKILQDGPILLNEAEHTVTVDGRPVELTLKEHEILDLFMRNPGKVFTRDELLTAIWDAAYEGETRTVDVHIATLRSKLGSSGELIRTVRGVGYKLERTQEQ